MWLNVLAILRQVAKFDAKEIILREIEPHQAT